MRQVTCFKMAIDGEGVKFLHSLSTKLAESFGFEIFDHFSTESSLHEFLKSSISSLPNCELKSHLEENIRSYRDQLKSLLEGKLKTVQVPCCSAVTTQSITESLKTIKLSSLTLSTEEVHHMYEELLMGSASNDYISFKEIINEWLEHLLHSADDDLLFKGINFLSCCLLNSDTLSFCLDAFIRLFSHLRTTPPSDNILSILYVIHFLTTCGSRDRCYDNQLSALLSIYVECCLTNCDKDDKDMSSHLARVLLTLSCKSTVALCALLQVNVPNNKEDILLSIIKSVLKRVQSSTSGAGITVYDLHVYVCFISCLNFANRLSQKSTSFEFKCCMTAPAVASRWLWGVDSSICERIGLKRSWSSDQLHNYLLSGLTKEKEDLLLELLSHSEEPRDSVALTSEVDGSDKDNAFFLDNEGDDGANMLEGSVIDRQSSKEETENAASAYIPVDAEEEDNKDWESTMLIDDQHKMNNAVNDETEADTNVNTSFDKVDTIVPNEEMESAATPVHKGSSAKRRKALLKKLRKSTTPPMMMKFSPRVLRSATKKKLLASVARLKQ